MDRYERVKTLGRGAFGVAVLVREKGSHPAASPGPLRVIKEIDLGQLSASARKDAQNEVIVLARFKHPNIVEYCTAFLDSDKQTLHIVMEYADGGDLAAIIRQRRDDQCRFSEGDALVILAQCLEALVHIHSKHVLHRDIKGQNIFAMKNGTVKLGDFGIARVLEHTASAAKTMIGTPNYLAPEVCENLPYNDRADMWSLGVVFYEVLTLQQPFQAYNMAALVLKIVTADPPPLGPEFGPEVTDIVNRTLRKKPELRPAAAEMLNLPAVRCLVGSRFQLSDSCNGRSALKSPSVLHAGNTAHLLSSSEPDYLRVDHAPSSQTFHTAIELGGEEEFHTAVDAVDELRQIVEARSPAPHSPVPERYDLPYEAQRSETALGHQELYGQEEQTRLNKDMLSPHELARLNKARVEGMPLNHAPWHQGAEQNDRASGQAPVGQAPARQAARDSQNPWDWQAISAQAELERRRNRERLTRQNWHGPGWGFLGGAAPYEHTPMGATGATSWRQDEEPADGRTMTRPLPTSDRQGTGSNHRSGSASSLGVAGSVVARSRPAPLGGSGGPENAPVASPGRTTRLSMGQGDGPDSTRSTTIRGSPRTGSRWATGKGADAACSEHSSMPSSAAHSRPATGSSMGGYDASRRHPSTSSGARRLMLDPGLGMEAGRNLVSPSTGHHASTPGASATPSAAHTRLSTAARGGGTDAARRRSSSGVRGQVSQGPSPTAMQSSNWASGATGTSAASGTGRRPQEPRVPRSGSRPRPGAGTAAQAVEMTTPCSSLGRADDPRLPTAGIRREAMPGSRRSSSKASAGPEARPGSNSGPRPGSRRSAAAKAREEAPAAAAEAPAAGQDPPTPAQLAERFAWASKFAHVDLDMQLPAYADHRGEHERLGELDNLFSQFAQLTDDADRAAAAVEEATVNPDADWGVGPECATLAAGIGFFAPGDITEDWSGAEMFNDAATLAASNVGKMQEGTVSRQDILAAVLKA